MKDEKCFVLETYRDVEYHLPRLNKKYDDICKAWENGTMEEDFKNECTKLHNRIAPTPNRLHDAFMYTEKGYGSHTLPEVVKYKSDKDGTIKILPGDEDHAIYLYKTIKHKLDERTHFNEKWGLPTPPAIREEQEQMARERKERMDQQKRLQGFPRSVML